MIYVLRSSASVAVVVNVDTPMPLCLDQSYEINYNYYAVLV